MWEPKDSTRRVGEERGFLIDISGASSETDDV